MKIGIKFSPPTEYRGGSQYILASYLVKALFARHDNLVLYTASPQYFDTINDLVIRKTENPYLQASLLQKGFTWLRHQITFIQAIKNDNCDVLFCPYTNEALWRDGGIPQVVTVHDMIPLIYPNHFKVTAALWKLSYTPILEKVNAIIAVSENTKKDILRFCDIPPNRVFVVPNGFSGKVEDLGGYSENKYGKYILYVSSSHYPYKNLSLLFDAYKNISSRFPHRLIIVGKSVPRFSYSVERKIADLGLSDKVILLENLMDHEMASLYRHADLFVYPSLYEGFGIPPLEAMAFCVPVVASNAASIPEVCGKAALYINPQNVDSITEGMYKGLTDRDLRQRLVTEGLERTKLFSWEKTAQAIITVCQNVLALA